MSEPTQPSVPPYTAQPGYHPVQPGSAAPPAYSPAGQPVPPTYGAPVSRPGNTAGRVALIIAIAAFALRTLATTVLIPAAMPTFDTYYTYVVINTILTVATALLAVVTLVFGIIGLRRKDAPHGTAGVGLGIAVTVLTTAFFSVITLFGSSVLAGY